MKESASRAAVLGTDEYHSAVTLVKNSASYILPTVQQTFHKSMILTKNYDFGKNYHFWKDRIFHGIELIRVKPTWLSSTHLVLESCKIIHLGRCRWAPAALLKHTQK